ERWSPPEESTCAPRMGIGQVCHLDSQPGLSHPGSAHLGTFRGSMVYLMSDLDLPVRDRIYREPEGPHVVIVRGRDLDAALDHLDARPDCRALAVIGLPAEVPDLELISGRRLLVVDRDRALMRELAEAGMAAGADVEWLPRNRPEFNRIAPSAPPPRALFLPAGPPSPLA